MEHKFVTNIMSLKKEGNNTLNNYSNKDIFNVNKAKNIMINNIVEYLLIDEIYNTYIDHVKQCTDTFIVLNLKSKNNDEFIEKYIIKDMGWQSGMYNTKYSEYNNLKAFLDVTGPISYKIKNNKNANRKRKSYERLKDYVVKIEKNKIEKSQSIFNKYINIIPIISWFYTREKIDCIQISIIKKI